ncbi:hypothetical protein JCM10213v2_001907 [Rhodosporidiobolus nylandii]
MADLNLALKSPAELIQRLYAEHGTLDGLEERVASTFASLFEDEKARSQLRALTSLSNAAALPPAGALVRFRAMVQDTGLGSELYRAVGAKGELFMYGADETEQGGADAQDDYKNLRERQVFYVVSVPGETQWVKEVYGDAAEQLKTTDVCEFIGVLGETSVSTAFDELSDSSPSAAPVPALHVILARPCSKASVPSVDVADKEALRQQLVDYLAASLGGDVDAAEWVLLALVARIHTRHATGMALGALSLNLAFPDSFSTSLSSVLSSLVPTLATLDLSIASLNDKATRLAPRSRDESLESGNLQLAPGTAVLVDLRGISEGKLEDTGVRNLRHLATTVSQQKLAYEFPFSSFELDTDLNFILLSEGKAIVPVIQADFVERRQASQGGEGMSQDDLLFRMTAARLMALSCGDAALSKEAWMRTAELDDRRKERMPVVPKQ